MALLLASDALPLSLHAMAKDLCNGKSMIMKFPKGENFKRTAKAKFAYFGNATAALLNPGLDHF